MRALLVTVGSRGDVQPMLALALGLRARGHEVGLCAPPENAAWAERHGLAFWPVGRDIQAYLNERIADGMKTVTNGRVLEQLFREELPKHLDGCVAAAEEFRPDLVGMAGLGFAATTAAERVGATCVWFPYTPAMFPSPKHAPAIMPVADLPRLANRALWRLNAYVFHKWIERPLNQGRLARGLAPFSSTYSSLPAEVVCAWDEPLAGPAEPEVPRGDRVIHPGAPLGHLDFDHAGEALDEDLAAFLDAGEPPLYLGFGSMPDTHPERTLLVAVEAARALGKRLVLLTGWSKRAVLEHLDERRVFVAERAPHTLLFPRCCALVHHGGAGTVAAAGRAGKPQVIVPHIVDQFDWASRLHARGLAPKRVPKAKLSERRLQRALEAALSEGMQIRAAAVGEELRAIDGVANACDALERLQSRA